MKMKKLKKKLSEIIKNNYFDVIVYIGEFDTDESITFTKDGDNLICNINHDISSGSLNLDIIHKQITELISYVNDIPVSVSLGFHVLVDEHVMSQEQVTIFETDQPFTEYLDDRMSGFNCSIIEIPN